MHFLSTAERHYSLKNLISYAVVKQPGHSICHAIVAPMVPLANIINSMGATISDKPDSHEHHVFFIAFTGLGSVTNQALRSGNITAVYLPMNVACSRPPGRNITAGGGNGPNCPRSPLPRRNRMTSLALYSATC